MMANPASSVDAPIARLFACTCTCTDQVRYAETKYSPVYQDYEIEP